MSEDLYRLEGHGPIPHGFDVDVHCGDKPFVPTCPKSLWFCQNQNCPTREVTFKAHYVGVRPPRKPPLAHCPLCGQPLWFSSYLIEVSVVPADGPKTDWGEFLDKKAPK